MAVELLVFVARHLLKRKTEPDDELSPVQHKVTDIVRHINLCYGKPLLLNDLAKRFYISKSPLSRVFKEVIGFGFSEYVNITRVKEAERLQRDTDWSITRISEHCGFDSFSHFGKMFKKLSGLTPRVYLKFLTERCGYSLKFSRDDKSSLTSYHQAGTVISQKPTVS